MLSVVIGHGQSRYMTPTPFSALPWPPPQAETLPCSQEEGQVLKPHSADEPSLLNLAGSGNFPLSLTQSGGPSDTRREFADVLVDRTQQNPAIATI